MSFLREHKVEIIGGVLAGIVGLFVLTRRGSTGSTAGTISPNVLGTTPQDLGYISGLGQIPSSGGAGGAIIGTSPTPTPAPVSAPSSPTSSLQVLSDAQLNEAIRTGTPAPGAVPGALLPPSYLNPSGTLWHTATHFNTPSGNTLAGGWTWPSGYTRLPAGSAAGPGTTYVWTPTGPVLARVG